MFVPMSEAIIKVQCRLHSRVPKEEKLCLLWRHCYNKHKAGRRHSYLYVHSQGGAFGV